MLLLSIPTAAFAAPAAPVNSGKGKFTKQETQVQATQTKLTKPEAPPPEKKETGPVLTVDQFVQGRQGKIQTITDAQISKMKRLITVTPDDDPQKPDFFFRLGELFAEKQRFYFAQAHSLDQKIFDAPAAQKTSLTQQQQSFQKSEEKWLLEAVKAYIQAAKYKKYERMDEVLFKLAFLLTSVKKEDQARVFFLRLIKDYPNSKYIPDAYLSFAEFYFDKGEMENALKFYEKVEQFPKSSVYPYAVYKKGWCYVNMGDFKTALETFVGVVRMATEGKVNVGAAQKQALVKEAKKDIVKAYAHVGGPEKAWEFFQRTGGDYAPKMMEALAELYWEQGKFARLQPRLQEDHRPEHGQPPHLRVAGQGGPQHAVRRQQARSGPGDRAAGRRLRQGRPDEGPEEGPDGGVPQLLPRHLQGAGADLAQGSPEDQERRHLPAGPVRLQGVPEALPGRQGLVRHELLLRRAPVDARAVEGRGRAVHPRGGDESQGQVRQGFGLRRRARVEERAAGR